MMKANKEYVLVSQGVEIYRTPNKEDAELQMNQMNNDWCRYCQECYDVGEKSADNGVFMYEE